jgi:hypothetical protein
MLQNRHIQVKVAKDSEPGQDTSLADTAYIVHATGESLIKGAGALMLTYIAADTLRQIVVHTAKIKIK